MATIRYRNPIKKGILDFDHGDPYVFSFDGHYYLFTSGVNPSCAGHVYHSTDMVNWEFKGDFTEEPAAIGSFAPEIIYWNGKFYLVTSPLGKGHYIFVSDKPMGPYKLVTDNFHHWIDGSFLLDDNNKLHLLHAQWTGVVICDVDENLHVGEEKVIAPSMDGWTEGPSVIQKDGKYYLFYCGNHYRARTYRVNYAISNQPLDGYTLPINNPLLVNAHGKYSHLGHSSEVLSKDLTTYVMFYHSKIRPNSNRTIQMDALHLGENFVGIHQTTHTHSAYLPLDFESYEGANLINKGNLHLANKKHKSAFALLGHIKGDSKLIFSYINDNDYVEVYKENDDLVVNLHKNSQIKCLFKKKCAFDFAYLHGIRIVKESRWSIYIDGVYFGSFKLRNHGGFAGYYSTNNDFSYLAFRNINVDNDHRKNPLSLEGVLIPEDFGVKEMSFYDEKEYFTYFHNDKEKEYVVSLLADVKDETTISINGTKYDLKATKGNNILILGKQTFSAKDVLRIKLLKGNIDIKLIKFIVEYPWKEYSNFHNKNNMTISHNDEPCFLLKNNKTFTIEYDFNTHSNDYVTLLANVNEFSRENIQCLYRFQGLMVNIHNDHLELFDVNFTKKKIGEINYNPLNKTTKCSISADRNVLNVTIDHQCFSFIVSSFNIYGQVGIMTSKDHHIAFKEVK